MSASDRSNPSLPLLAKNAGEVNLSRTFADGELAYRDRTLTGGRRVYKWAPSAGEPGALPSVSSVLDTLAKPGVEWHQRKLGAERSERERDLSAARGDSLHDALELWARTGGLPDPADLDPEHRPFLRGLSRALLVLDPVPVVSELLVCLPPRSVATASGNVGYAGRLDLIAEVDGRRCILDLKTNAKGRGYDTGHLQLAAYLLAEQLHGKHEPEGALLLGVGPDGSFAADEVTADAGDWLAVLTCFDAVRGVKSRVAAMHRAADAAVAA